MSTCDHLALMNYKSDDWKGKAGGGDGDGEPRAAVRVLRRRQPPRCSEASQPLIEPVDLTIRRWCRDRRGEQHVCTLHSTGLQHGWISWIPPLDAAT